MINQLSPSLPEDIWKEIISFSKDSLTLMSCVDIQLNKLIEDYVKKNPLQGLFGEKEWKYFNGDPGIVSPIPLKMYQDFDASKYMLTFIPETINGETLTLTCIDKFIKKYNNTDESNYRYPLSNYFISDETVSKFKAHWVMLSKDVLDGTRNKTFEIQKKLVEEKEFEIPNLIDTVVSLLMHKMKTGEFIYPDDSNGHQYTVTRVQEKNNRGYRIIVGGFSALGLRVDYHGDYDSGNFGAACARKSIGT